MANQQLKAELTLTFKRDLPDDLDARMAAYFARASDDVAVCAAPTALAGLTHTLKLVAFARNHDTTAYLYFKENVRTLKVHVEWLKPIDFATLEAALTGMKKMSNVETKNMRSFAKVNKNKIVDEAVAISSGDVPMFTAQQKSYITRLRDSVKTNLLAKAVVPVGTAAAGLIYLPDPPSALKAVITGFVIVVIATLVEAGTTESFKYERS